MTSSRRQGGVISPVMSITKRSYIQQHKQCTAYESGNSLHWASLWNKRRWEKWGHSKQARHSTPSPSSTRNSTQRPVQLETLLPMRKSNKICITTITIEIVLSCGLPHVTTTRWISLNCSLPLWRATTEATVALASWHFLRWRLGCRDTPRNVVTQVLAQLCGPRRDPGAPVEQPNSLEMKNSAAFERNYERSPSWQLALWPSAPHTPSIPMAAA